MFNNQTQKKEVRKNSKASLRTNQSPIKYQKVSPHPIIRNVSIRKG